MPDGISITPKAAPAPTDQGFVKDEVSPVAGFLNADKADYRLQSVVDFFKEEGKDLLEADLLWKIRALETKLGLPSLGETRLDKVHRYVKLQGQISSLEKRRDGELR